MRFVALLICLSLAFTAGPSWSQAVILRGKVVTIENRPATDARLTILGHAALLAIRNPSGEFEQPLSGHPSSVEVSVIDGPLKVLYPLNGVVPVPKDPNVLVTIVVGKAEKTFLADQLADRLVKLEGILKANGVDYNASVDSLSGDIRRVLVQLQLQDADLRRGIADKRSQAAVTPEILRVLADYILKVKDLKDAYAQFGPLAATHPGAMTSIKDALTRYNTAFTAFNNNRQAYDSNIMNYWTPERREMLKKYLADVYLEAIENIHKPIVLTANPSLVELQLAYGPHPPKSSQLATAAHALENAANQMGLRIVVLEQRALELREALGRD